jgi:hypothetical protein
MFTPLAYIFPFLLFKVFVQVHVCRIMHKLMTQQHSPNYQNKDRTQYAHALLTQTQLLHANPFTCRQHAEGIWLGVIN